MAVASFVAAEIDGAKMIVQPHGALSGGVGDLVKIQFLHGIHLFVHQWGEQLNDAQRASEQHQHADGCAHGCGQRPSLDLNFTQEQNNGSSNETYGHRDQQQPHKPFKFPKADSEQDETNKANEVA